MCHKKPVSPMMGDRATSILQQGLYTKLSDLMTAWNEWKHSENTDCSKLVFYYVSFSVFYGEKYSWGGFYGLVWVKAMLNSQVKLIEALRKSSNFLDYTFFFYLELICFFWFVWGFFLWLLEVKEWTFLLFLDCVDESISALLFWCIWIVFCNSAFWQWSQTNSGSNHRALNRTYIEQQWATDIM